MGVAATSLPVMVLLSAGLLIGFGGWCVQLARRRRLPAWVPGLLIGGAAANLLDRIAFGAVHDWLRVPHFDLNLADLFVQAGLVGFGLALVAQRDFLELKGWASITTGTERPPRCNSATKAPNWMRSETSKQVSVRPVRSRPGGVAEGAPPIDEAVIRPLS